MISIKLRNQIPRLVAKSEFLGVTREHNLGDIYAKKLSFLSLAQTVEKDIVDSALLTADNSLFAIFVQVHRLILHVDLLFQLQVALTKDQDLSFKGHVDIG